MKKLFLTPFILFATLLAGAADYNTEFARLVSRAAEQSAQYWQQEHFGEKPFPADAKIYDGRNVHDYTMLYWNLLNAKLNQNTVSRERALKHYRFTSDHFWDAKKRLFRTGYDFLSNTSIAMAMLLSLRDAREMIPPETIEDMREKIRGIALYLPTYTTALTNNNDLRANNQDAFATFALALAAQELQDASIRKNALDKFRAILAVTGQSFWIEGGVDTGYQSVGEAAFMNAADLLWDDLSYEERGKVAALQLNAPTANGFGLENARSSSWINRQPIRAVSTGLLARVPNGFLAADAEGLFLEMSQKGFPSKWWLHDPASLSFFAGFYKNRAAIASTPKNKTKFASGSLACQIMERDEQRGFHSGMEKAYITGTSGTTAMFGDYTRLHPEQQIKKFGASHPPFTPNAGGLRYLGKELHLFVVPDAMLGAPRLFSTDLRRAPQLFERASYPGVGVSEYMLKQVFPGLNSLAPQIIEQSFAVIGDVMVILFKSDASLTGFSFGVSMPFSRMSAKANRITIEQPALTGKKPEFLDIYSFGTSPGSVGGDRWKPYFQNELTVAGQKVKLPPLRLVNFAFENQKNALLFFAPGRHAANVRVDQTAESISLSFTEHGVNYQAIVALKALPALKINDVTINAPAPGYWQVIGVKKEQLELLALRAQSATRQGKELFSAATPCTLSVVRSENGWLLNTDTQARIGDFCGSSAQSLIDGTPHELPAQLPATRLTL